MEIATFLPLLKRELDSVYLNWYCMAIVVIYYTCNIGKQLITYEYHISQ